MSRSGFTFHLLGAVLGTALFFTAAVNPQSASASSCNREIVVPIKIAPGRMSWHHRGIGTTFVGQFARAQTILVHAMGTVFTSAGSGKIKQTTEPWDLTIEGPNKFIANNAGSGDGTLKVTIPATGVYRIKTYPCAIWGNSGDVTITAFNASTEPHR